MKNKLIFFGAAFIAISLLLLAGCASKSPQEQLQLNEIDKLTYQRALSTQNLGLCAAIENKDLKSNCEITISEQKLKTEIVVSKDASRCGSLTVEQLKKSCELEIKQTLELDKKSQEFQKELNEANIELNKIIDGGDLKKCEQLKDENFVKACKNGIFFNRAYAEKNASLCKKIEDDSAKQNICVSNIPQ